MRWLEGLRVWLNIRAAKRYWSTGVPKAGPVLVGLTAVEALQEARHWLDHGPPARLEVRSVRHAEHECFVITRMFE